jgi:hypothetical protein
MLTGDIGLPINVDGDIVGEVIWGYLTTPIKSLINVRLLQNVINHSN